MEEKDIQLTEKEMQRMFTTILKDDTHWDLMTGKELEKRIKAYRANKGNKPKLIPILGCLRLADVYYPYKQEGEAFSMPTLPLPEGAMVMVFTSKVKCKAESLKEYKFNSATVIEILNSFESDAIKFVCVNPLTDDFILPIEPLKQFTEMADRILCDVDNQMMEGIEFKDLDTMTFERFGGKRIECDTSYGQKIVGECYSFHEDKTLGPCLTITTDDEETVDLYYNQVERIKDITDYDVDGEE